MWDGVKAHCALVILPFGTIGHQHCTTLYMKLKYLEGRTKLYGKKDLGREKNSIDMGKNEDKKWEDKKVCGA